MKIHIFPILILVFLNACTTATSNDPLAEKIKKVETHLSPPVYIEGDTGWTIEERMAHYGVPGVSIAVIHDYKIAWVKSYGVKDKDIKEPVTESILFQAGSISKPVSAYGALKLVQQHKMDLDSNINVYLKSWKLPDNEFTKTKKVTLRHLLSHTGGTTVHGFLGYSPGLPVPTLIQVLDGTPPANSPAVRVDKMPGESFRYSGGGTSIVQLAMLETEGKLFPDLMHDLVLSPLGMKNSTYDQPLKDTMLLKAATGYLPDGSMTKGKRHTYPEMAAAGLWTTAKDLASFAIDIQQTYKGNSKTVLDQNMVTKMLTPFVTDFVGLGLFLNKKKDEIYFGHGGWDEGFSSELTAHRDKGYGVVVLINANQPNFISELIRSVALVYDWDDYLPVYKKMDESPKRMEEISGRYRRGNDALIEIYLSGNRMMRKHLGAEPVELIKISDSSYISRTDESPIKFIYNAKNNQTELIRINPNTGAIESTYTLMKQDEKIPHEYLLAGQYDLALQAYQALLKSDPKDPAVNEDNLNNRGYQVMNEDKIKLAKEIFKINMMLYPNSANVYDSYAEACMKNKETDLAIDNYKKSLQLNPKNDHAVKMIEEMESAKSKQ